MNRKYLALNGALSLSLTLGLLTPASAQEARALFRAHEDATLTLPTEEFYLQSRHITLTEGALDTRALAFDLELFDGLIVTSRQQSVVENRSGSVSWIGSIEGDPNGQVVLVSKERVTVGSIRTNGRLFMVEYVAAGVHKLLEVDESSERLQELPPAQVSPSREQIEALAEAKSAQGDDGSVIDIMVVYTTATRISMGGVVATENLVDLGVTETNLSYQNSGVLPRIDLVHVQEVPYVESGSAATDRDRLRIDGDGHLDEVHPLRDMYGADLVQMIIDSGGCGIAYIMTNVGPEFEEFGFCVTWRVCVSPNYTFAHEIGHLQSARHDYFVDPTVNSPFSYNHGYTDPGNQWRTVMAYSNGCGGCQRQLYWSNPDVNHPVTGNAMGVPEGLPQAADNRKTLNTTAFTVANFRSSAFFEDGFESGDTASWSATVGTP